MGTSLKTVILFSSDKHYHAYITWLFQSIFGQFLEIKETIPLYSIVRKHNFDTCDPIIFMGKNTAGRSYSESVHSSPCDVITILPVFTQNDIQLIWDYIHTHLPAVSFDHE